MRAFVSLLIAVSIVAFASEAFATKIYKQVSVGTNCVGDYFLSTDADTIDFVFSPNVPYSSASFTVLFDTLGAHGTYSAIAYYFPSYPHITADMSPASDTTATFIMGIDTLMTTSFGDSLYWRKVASADSTAIVTFTDESYFWSDDFRPVSGFLIRVIATCSSGTCGHVLCLNVMAQ